MSVNRPNNNTAEAHFYSKESAIYGSDERYLISSKGNRQEIPLTKSCANFNGSNTVITFPVIVFSSTISTIMFHSKLSVSTETTIFVENSYAGSIFINQGSNQIKFIDKDNITTIVNLTENNKQILLGTFQHYYFEINNHTALITVYLDGVLAGTSSYIGTAITEIYHIYPSSNTQIYELIILNISLTPEEILNASNFIYATRIDSGKHIHYRLEESLGTICYDLSSNAWHGQVADTLNSWYKGADVPRSYANREGYTLGAGGEIIPAKSTLLDVLNNDLQYKGQVRYRAKIKNPTVAFLDLTTTITFTVWPTSGVTFTYKGTATGVVISSTGVLSVTGAGTLYDLKVFFSGVLTEHYPLNEGSGSYINTIGTGRHGYLKGHTDPNQWVVADVEDVFLINNYEILKYDEDYRINDSLTIGDFPQYVTHVPGQGYEIENTIFSAAGTILTQQWSIATDSDYFLDLTYTYTAGTERTNISITANYQNQAIALPDGINSTIRLFYNNNQDSGFSFSMGNISTNSGKITLHSAKHYEVNKSKSDRPGYLPTNSQIDFNPDEALSENVPRNYVYGDTIPANAYMYINQSKRLPSTFDFLIYEKELTSSDEIRRITDYIS